MAKAADITFKKNTFYLSGILDFSNVMSVYNKSLEWFSQCEELRFDFSKLVSSNSAGLALVLEWIKRAEKEKKPIKFLYLSEHLMSIAEASGLTKLIVTHSK